MINTYILIIGGIIFNFAIIKFLVMMNPHTKFRGPRGDRGTIGEIGPRGEVGNKGRQDRGGPSLIGSPGDEGVKGLGGSNNKWAVCNTPEQRRELALSRDMELDSNDINMSGGCLPNVKNTEVNEIRDKWGNMGLTSHAARNRGCLFGYKYMDGICKSPRFGNNEYPNNLGIDWTDNSRITRSGLVPNNICSYKFNKIKNMCPKEFESWAKIMSNRDCPGVPVGGSVSFPKENQNLEYDTSGNINMGSRGNKNSCVNKLKKLVNYNQSELNNANNECPIGFWKGSNDKCYPTCNSPSQSRDIQGRCICNGSNEHHKKCTSDSKCLKNNDTYVCQPNEIRFN